MSMLKGVTSVPAMPPMLRIPLLPRPAHEPAGPGAGVLALTEGDLAGIDGGDVALGLLDEAAAVTGQVEDQFGEAQREPVVVDDVQVGLVPGCDDTPVG